MENAHNLRVVTTATDLSLTFTYVREAREMNWEQQSEKVRERHNRVVKLPLSVFVRVTAAVTFKSSIISHHVIKGNRTHQWSDSSDCELRAAVTFAVLT